MRIVVGQVTDTYTYDGNNTRITKLTVNNSVAPATITTSTYIGSVEYQTSNTVISTYDGVAARTTTGNPSTGNQGTLVYLHRDHLNSVSLTTSATGAALEQQEFDTWGAVKSGGITSVSYSYTGQRRDASTGLLFYNARYYDPALARFTQADSIVPSTSRKMSLVIDFHEGTLKDEAIPVFSQSLNRYSYTNNNPLTYSDPSGHIFYKNDTPESRKRLRDMIDRLNQGIDQLEDLKDDTEAWFGLIGDILSVFGPIGEGVAAGLNFTLDTPDITNAMRILKFASQELSLFVDNTDYSMLDFFISGNKYWSITYFEIYV